jgi:hypothetical protein
MGPPRKHSRAEERETDQDTRSGPLPGKEGPSTSRRGQARFRSRRATRLSALTAAVGLVVHGGPRDGVDAATWDAAVAKAMTGCDRAPNYLWGSRRSLLCGSAPPWGENLLSLGVLSEDAPNLNAVMKRILPSSSRFCRGSSPGPCGKPPPTEVLCVSPNTYSISRADTKKLFRRIDPATLDLPPAGRELLDPTLFLDWPFNRVLSEETLARCRAPRPPGWRPKRGNTSLNLAPGVSQKDFFQSILHMCYITDDPDFLAAPENGAFGVHKKDGSDREHVRFVANDVNGNEEWSMELLQAEYTAELARFPERARALGLPAKIMDIASQANLVDLPPGAVNTSSSDFESYFYQFFQLPCLWRSQGFRNHPRQQCV